MLKEFYFIPTVSRTVDEGFTFREVTWTFYFGSYQKSWYKLEYKG